jgi:hypothetical protein
MSKNVVFRAFCADKIDSVVLSVILTRAWSNGVMMGGAPNPRRVAPPEFDSYTQYRKWAVEQIYNAVKDYYDECDDDTYTKVHIAALNVFPCFDSDKDDGGVTMNIVQSFIDLWSEHNED